MAAPTHQRLVKSALEAHIHAPFCNGGVAGEVHLFARRGRIRLTEAAVQCHLVRAQFQEALLSGDAALGHLVGDQPEEASLIRLTGPGKAFKDH